MEIYVKKFDFHISFLLAFGKDFVI